MLCQLRVHCDARLNTIQFSPWLRRALFKSVEPTLSYFTVNVISIQNAVSININKHCRVCHIIIVYRSIYNTYKKWNNKQRQLMTTWSKHLIGSTKFSNLIQCDGGNNNIIYKSSVLSFHWKLGRNVLCGRDSLCKYDLSVSTKIKIFSIWTKTRQLFRIQISLGHRKLAT